MKCILKFKVISKTTPKVLTLEKGEIGELSVDRENLPHLPKTVVVPTRRSAILSQFNLRKLADDLILILCKQSVKEEGERVHLDLVDR